MPERRDRQSADGQPSSRARPKVRGMSPSRSRHSSKARSNRNSSGPVRAARSRRWARSWRSNNSGGTAPLVRRPAFRDKRRWYAQCCARSGGLEICCSILRFRRDARAVAKSSPRQAASVRNVGVSWNGWATVAASIVDCRWLEPMRKPAADASPTRPRSTEFERQLPMTIFRGQSHFA